MPAEIEPEPAGVRAWVEWYLAPLLPASWKIHPGIVTPAKIDRPTVTLTHTKINRLPQAPASSSTLNDIVIRVADPHEDLTKAEDDLDIQVLLLIDAIRRSERLSWSEAEKVKTGDSGNLAWDITVQFIAKPTPTPEAPEE